MTFLEPHRLAVQNERLLPMPDKAVYDTELYLLAALLLYAYLLYKNAPRLLAYFRFLFDWRALDKVAPGRQGNLDRQGFYAFSLIAVGFVTVSLYLYQWAAHPELTAGRFGPAYHLCDRRLRLQMAVVLRYLRAVQGNRFRCGGHSFGNGLSVFLGVVGLARFVGLIRPAAFPTVCAYRVGRRLYSDTFIPLVQIARPEPSVKPIFLPPYFFVPLRP